MPKFNTTLGCEDASWIWQRKTVTFSVPVEDAKHHEFNYYGEGRSGTALIITSGDANATEVVYEMTLRSDKQQIADQYFKFTTTEVSGGEQAIQRSVATLSAQNTGGFGAPIGCMRSDVIMRVPPNLKGLKIHARGPVHLQFAHCTHSDLILDELDVILEATERNNMLLPHASLRARHTTLRAYNGWVVGEVPLVDKVSLLTDFGRAVSNLKVYPVERKHCMDPTAQLETLTGVGRTDIDYIDNAKEGHRPIDASHISQDGGDLYLTYKKAKFNGFIERESRSFTGHNINNAIPKPGATGDDAKSWVGDKQGGDKLTAKSSLGWIGLYF